MAECAAMATPTNADRPRPVRADPDDERLRYIQSAQAHCDRFLAPIADPRDKSVVVVGCGAGTEMLWALRHGAREVVGLDVVPQSPVALTAAAAEAGLDTSRFRILQLAAEDAAALGRRFDLVLSNNVFEHLPDLVGAFHACAALVAPWHGRVAVFTDPLYFSSAGSHLPIQPWEHLWAEPAALRSRLLPDLPPRHPLHELELAAYLDDEITLNRMRLVDFVDAARQSGLAFLNLQLIVDRALATLPARRAAIAARWSAEVGATADLALEGIAAELLLPSAPDDPTLLLESPEALAESVHRRQLAERQAEIDRLYVEEQRLTTALTSQVTELARLHQEVDGLTTANHELHVARGELVSTQEALGHAQQALTARGDEIRRLQGEESRLTAGNQALMSAVGELQAETGTLTTRLATAEAETQAVAAHLAALQASPSYRLGRALTAPLRVLRDLGRR